MYLLHRRCGSAQLPEQVTYGVQTNSLYLGSPLLGQPWPRLPHHLPKDILKAQPESGTPVMVLVDRDLGTGVDEKRDAGDPSLEWNKGALFAETHVYISSYKAASGSKKNLEQKQCQANNLLRARKHPISWVRGALSRWPLSKRSLKGGHWRESMQVPFIMISVLRTACSSACSCFPGTDKEERVPEEWHTEEEKNILDPFKLNVPWHSPEQHQQLFAHLGRHHKLTLCPTGLAVQDSNTKVMDWLRSLLLGALSPSCSEKVLALTTALSPDYLGHTSTGTKGIESHPRKAEVSTLCFPSSDLHLWVNFQHAAPTRIRKFFKKKKKNSIFWNNTGCYYLRKVRLSFRWRHFNKNPSAQPKSSTRRNYLLRCMGNWASSHSTWLLVVRRLQNLFLHKKNSKQWVFLAWHSFSSLSTHSPH